MLRWLANLIARRAPTPEKQAERALADLRMALFEAEKRVLDARLQAEFYRTRIAFCEEVLQTGIEQTSNHRKEHEETLTPDPGVSLKLTSSH